MNFDQMVLNLLEWMGPVDLAKTLEVSPAILYVWRDGGQPRLSNFQKVQALHQKEARKQKKIKKN